jgi:hypothetical protein
MIRPLILAVSTLVESTGCAKRLPGVAYHESLELRGNRPWNFRPDAKSSAQILTGAKRKAVPTMNETTFTMLAAVWFLPIHPTSQVETSGGRMESIKKS